MTPPVRLAEADLTEAAEDRFSRFRLIHWWDQERIRRTKILVAGAGALGNEILKNLALLGFERVVVVDCDRIELSNLSRSVLFRAADVGRSKAEAAAEAVRALYPDSKIVGRSANLLYDAGLGLFEWADVILGGLDNREARLWINRAAWRVGRPWIDGAIEGLSGLARVFLPGQPPCYECTLGEIDWQILDRRMSCNLLTRDEMAGGKVPTTPTTAAVIAGIQVQEALKLIHGLPVLAGKAFVFDGLGHTSYVVEYSENPDCMSHYTEENVVRLPQKSGELRLRDLLEQARRELGNEAVIEFSRDIVWMLSCPSCGAEEEIFLPVGRVTTAEAQCPNDGALRVVAATHSYTGVEPFGDRTLDGLGLPPWDLYTARAGARQLGYLIDGDAEALP